MVVLLFDFVDVKHTREPEYYSRIVKEMNASFYKQSYGQTWIVGGEVYGWYETELKLSSLKVTTWYVDWAHADKLEAVATTKAGQLHVAGKYIFAVFAGDVWSWATGHPSKMSVIGETKWGLRTFMHEFGHNLGLPDLYNYQELEAEPVGEWDLMDRGEEELSTYSRLSLGWLSRDSVVTTYSTRDLTLLINSLDSPNGTRALKVQLFGSGRFLLAEVRRKPDGLYFVIYRIEGSIQSGQGSIVLEAVLNPNKRPVFFDKKVDAAFIVLDQQQDSVKIRVAREAESKKAEGALSALESASDSVDNAWSSNKVEGLAEAKQELDKAWQSFHSGDFDAAKTVADRAQELAKAAKVPESCSRFQELRPNLGARLQNASAYKSDEAIRHVELAQALLQDADDLFAQKDFDTALQKLREADQDLGTAAEAENKSIQAHTSQQTQRIFLPGLSTELLTVVGLVVVMVIVAAGIFAIRRKRRPPPADAIGQGFSIIRFFNDIQSSCPSRFSLFLFRSLFSANRLD
jgi:hypothetical protein